MTDDNTAPTEPFSADDDDLLDEEANPGGFDIWKAPVREDPWGRWPAGDEPWRELEIVYVNADSSVTALMRNTSIEVEPGVIPDPRHDFEGDSYSDLQFVSRWNATWRGARLTELSLDLFSKDWPEMLRLVLDPSSPVELLCAYHASYPGLWGIDLCNHGTPARNARDEPLGHQVVCRDPRLALRIGARYPGVASHAAFLQSRLWHPEEPTSDAGRELMSELRAAARRVSKEPVPGAHEAMQDDPLKALTAVLVGEAEPPPTIGSPFAASLDTYSLIATSGLTELADADLVRADRKIVNQLAAHVTFPDAVAAIRRSDPNRLPLWIDFTDNDGEPLRRLHAAGIEQPLYGALVGYDETDEDRPPWHAVVLVGRTCGLIEEAVPLCVLGIGPDDRWRFPMKDNHISVLTAHSGGVTVRHVAFDFEYHGVEPPIAPRELAHELARSMQRATEWALARVGAVLSALDDGLLLLERRERATRTYDLVRAPAGPATTRTAALPDAASLARRLRELGSLHRVAEVTGVEPAAAYRVLELAGVDPDQVLRDEVLTRWRRTVSIEAVVAATHLQRDLVERYLLEAGLDPADTPVPHDVTDPDVLAAVSAYREAGTLEAAGERLAISGETVRRRIARAGLSTDEIETEAERRLAHEAVEAWERAGRSLVGAAREIGVDPRTVKERLRRAGISAATLQGTNGDRKHEVRALYEQLGSRQAVATVLGMSPKTVRELLADEPAPAGPEEKTAPAGGGSRRGRPRVSDEELTRAADALAEHGTMRAAARALGLSTGGMAHRLKLARERGLAQDPDDTRPKPRKEH